MFKRPSYLAGFEWDKRSCRSWALCYTFLRFHYYQIVFLGPIILIFDLRRPYFTSEDGQSGTDNWGAWQLLTNPNFKANVNQILVKILNLTKIRFYPTFRLSFKYCHPNLMKLSSLFFTKLQFLKKSQKCQTNFSLTEKRFIKNWKLYRNCLRLNLNFFLILM